jgi:hypothetical protein
VKRIILSALFFVFILSAADRTAYSATIGVVWIKTDSPRATSVRDSMNTLLSSYSAFVPVQFVNPALLYDQLNRFSCIDEKCILGFGHDAGIDIVVLGSVEDMGDSIVINLDARPTDKPYNGKRIINYQTIIDLKKSSPTGDFTNFFSEHSGRFLAELLKRYRFPVYLVRGIDNHLSGKIPDGNYSLFRENPADTTFFREIGSEEFISGKSVHAFEDSRGRYYVEQNNEAAAHVLEEYIYGRKHELLFETGTLDAPFYAFAAIPVMSVLSPVVLPAGYYRNRDYAGFAFAAMSAIPWGVFSFQGLSDTYHDKKHFTASERGRQYFSLYWFFAGNASLVVDMYAHEALLSSKSYNPQRFLGNTPTAIVLSAVTPGGGLFYRGERFWGYFYYHSENYLLYKTLVSFSKSDRYNESNGKYEKSGYDKKKAGMYLSAFALLKGIEIVHAVCAPDRILSDTKYGKLDLFPLIEPDGRSTRIGAGVACQW